MFLYVYVCVCVSMYVSRCGCVYKTLIHISEAKTLGAAGFLAYCDDLPPPRMCLCVYLCVFVCLCVYLCVCIYVCVVDLSVWSCVCVFVHLCEFVNSSKEIINMCGDVI